MTIKDFYDKAAKDTDLQAKIGAAMKGGKGLEDIIKEFGIEGSVDDLTAYAKSLGVEGKLDKAQLDEVAGGTTPTVSTVVPAAGAGISVASLASC